MGELSAETASTARAWLRLRLSNGALRDTNFLLDLGFPVLGHAPHARDVVGVWLPTRTDEEIMIAKSPFPR